MATDVIAADAVEVVPAMSAPLVQHRTVDQLLEEIERVDDAFRRAMKPDVHYGIIPGTPKPSLLQPGAEMLLALMGLGCTTDVTRIDYDDAGEVRTVWVKAIVGVPVAGGVVPMIEHNACASYRESNFAETREDRQRRENANALRYNRQPKVVAEGYEAPLNTLVAMAEKRAFVGAVKRATRASGLFTQDRDEEQGSPDTTRSELVGEVRRLAEALGPAGCIERQRVGEYLANAGLPSNPVAMSTAQLVRAALIIDKLLISEGDSVPPATPRPADVNGEGGHGPEPGSTPAPGSGRGRRRREPAPEPADYVPGEEPFA